MPTDTIETLDQVHRSIYDLLAEEPESDAARVARLLHGSGLGLDSLVDLVAAAVQRRARNTAAPHTVGFLSNERWARDPHGPYGRSFLRVYYADVVTTISPCPVSRPVPGDPYAVEWRIFIGGNLLCHADGSPAVYSCASMAMDVVEQVMGRMKLTIDAPTVP